MEKQANWIIKQLKDKKKTGDLEMLRTLWNVCMALVAKDAVDFAAQKEQRDTWAAYLQDQNTKVTDVSVPDAEDVTQVLMDEYPTLPEAANVVAFANIQTKSPMFMVNLVLMDYRTARGGAERKDRPELKGELYARPFESNLPIALESLIAGIKEVKTSRAEGEVVSLQIDPSEKYILPERVTVTIPKKLPVAEVDQQNFLIDPPRGENQAVIYRDIGSFGFNEPSFTRWENSDGSPTDTDGTRLSPGSRVLCMAYIDGIVGLVKSLEDDQEDVEAYRNYGSPALEHLVALAELARKKGKDLAFRDVMKTCDAAHALVAQLCEQTKEHQIQRFALNLLDKIRIRHTKLETLFKLKIGEKVPEAMAAEVAIDAGDGTFTETMYFERLGVIESTLWEFAMLAAAFLPWPVAMATLRKVAPKWIPVMNAEDETESKFTSDTVVIIKDPVPRFFFPTGQAAAMKLYEFLLKQGYHPREIPVGRQTLHEYTPYFEFYQYNEFLLNTKNENSVGDDFTDPLQLWLNLSDSLHWRLQGNSLEACGAMIASNIKEVMEKEYKIKQATSLVLDYTKICSNIPSSLLYGILAEIAEKLLEDENIPHVWFLRSTLKYNTGTLDRYQSGEVLFFDEHSGLELEGLKQMAYDSFHSAEEPDWAKWSLKGNYIPLMHRTRLLSDAIVAAKWEAYVEAVRT